MSTVVLKKIKNKKKFGVLENYYYLCVTKRNKYLKYKIKYYETDNRN